MPRLAGPRPAEETRPEGRAHCFWRRRGGSCAGFVPWYRESGRKGRGGKGWIVWLLAWTAADSYKDKAVCLSIRGRGKLTASHLKLAASKSLTASSALRINFRSNIPQILKHSLVIRVHRQVDGRLIPIILAKGDTGILKACKPQTSSATSATCTARTQGSRLEAYE